ncbi:alpha-isopropylmalate synthase regulatory domain-containing protein [Lentisphaerota bacterium ZTH]|nr:2-isopropylmalate synthase [Lentisphaerota bacterium]WET06234.1 alpha-isopropylmalate synthase regulatory domain-containing protein [Lentisphaerota bacterium ZTH]
MKLKHKFDRYVEIMDTTLRDGEQTPGVAYTPAEKLQLARLLLTKVRADRLEVGSARVSEGEKKGLTNIIEWAEKRGLTDRLEILGFVDGGKSVDWICEVGGKVINLLAKGSEKHCRVQLGKTPEEHFNQVAECIRYADSKGLTVNLYLEDWSSGMRDSFQYVHAFIKYMRELPVARFMLPDTLGVITPAQITRYLEWLYASFPDIRLDFHGHNDYGMVTANSLAAVEAGINGIHTTINGLGERAGNQSLGEIAVAIHDMTDRKTHIAEKQLQFASTVVQNISGKRNSWNTPIVGSDVFTQTCGVHADGDKKGNLYANPLLPERFSRRRLYALGKLSGKASLEKNLEELGLELDQDLRKKVLHHIVRLGDKKKSVTPADLPFIISDVLRTPIEEKVKFVSYDITSGSKTTPTARVVIKYKDEEITTVAKGDGGYDAFMKAVRSGMKKFGVTIPRLLDYEVRIPPGGKTDALVETTITWESGNVRPIITIGVDSDQTAAAIEATSKMLNLVLNGD